MLHRVPVYGVRIQAFIQNHHLVFQNGVQNGEYSFPLLKKTFTHRDISERAQNLASWG